MQGKAGANAMQVRSNSMAMQETKQVKQGIGLRQGRGKVRRGRSKGKAWGKKAMQDRV
jgi:hypothetical protein